MGRVHDCRKSIMLAVVLMVLTACSKAPAPYNPKVVATRQLAFYLDRRFNSGQPLTIVVFFATPENPIKALLAKKVENLVAAGGGSWPYKVVLRLQQGEPSPVRLALTPPPHPTDIVVMADYLHIKGRRGQVVVLDANSSPTEVIFVTGKGIYR